MLESKITGEFLFNRFGVHETEKFEQEAQIVVDLVTRWGMVAAIPDGEDSAGRTKLRLMTCSELVERAFDTARAFMFQARLRNLVHTLPSLAELKKKE